MAYLLRGLIECYHTHTGRALREPRERLLQIFIRIARSLAERQPTTRSNVRGRKVSSGVVCRRLNGTVCRSGIGASCPFETRVAKVGSPPDPAISLTRACRPLTTGNEPFIRDAQAGSSRPVAAIRLAFRRQGRAYSVSLAASRRPDR